MNMNTNQSPAPTTTERSNGQLCLGPNFSGRSARLMAAVAKANDRGFFIGPEVISAFSGFAATVQKELDYFSGGTEARGRSLAFLDSLGMKHVLSRNPFTLSGGEQAVAALAVAISSDANVLAADCCLEQLDWQIRSAIFERLNAFCTAAFIAADNRADEYDIPEFVRPFQLLATKETIAATLDHTALPNRSLVSESLTLENVTARYSERGDFMLSVPRLSLLPGRIYRLTGPNGAGKTTLCRVLVGLMPVASGTILFGNRRVDPWRHPGRIAALSFQSPDHQLFATTVESELLDRGCPAELIKPTLRGFGVATSNQSHPGSLPFVLRKRLSLAATFSASRGWYILDEPTIGQDGASMEEVALLAKRFAFLGCGVIIISHSERFARLLDAHNLSLKGGMCVSE